MLKPVTVPATLVRSKTGGVAAFAVLVVKGKQLYFEIDTGASNTVLDTSIAAELGLTAAGPTVTRGTLGCTATSQPMQVSDWSVGGEALPPGILITTKTQFAGKKLNGLPFAGLLGADLDAAFGELTVDYAGKTVTLGGQVSPTGKAVPVQILRNKGEVQVRTSAMVHAVSTAMVIDTGASTSEVDTTLAKRAGLKNVGEPQTVDSVSCSTKVQPVTLDRMVVGSVAMPTVVGISSTIPSTSSSTAESFGLIGSDILSSYGRIGIDFTAGKLVLGS